MATGKDQTSGDSANPAVPPEVTGQQNAVPLPEVKKIMIQAEIDADASTRPPAPSKFWRPRVLAVTGVIALASLAIALLVVDENLLMNGYQVFMELRANSVGGEGGLLLDESVQVDLGEATLRFRSLRPTKPNQTTVQVAVIFLPSNSRKEVTIEVGNSRRAGEWSEPIEKARSTDEWATVSVEGVGGFARLKSYNGRWIPDWRFNKSAAAKRFEDY